MNIASRTLRNLGLALVAGLSLAQAAQAAPQTYGPRNTVRFDPGAPAKRPSCPDRERYVYDGSTKQRKLVIARVCDEAQPTGSKRWIGPRNTIPVTG